MEHLFSSVLLAVCSNIDNLGVGVAYGIRARRIYSMHNLLIALVSGSGTLLSMAAGHWVNNYMSEHLAETLGSGIMILIGVYSILHTLSIERNSLTCNQSGSSNEVVIFGTHTREAFALAFSLSLNNLGSGLGAGIASVSIPLTTILTMVLSVAAINGGYYLGKNASVRISKLWLGLASGLLIMAVGVYELFV